MLHARLPACNARRHARRPALHWRTMLARPERSRFTLWDDPAGGIPLELPPRKMWPVGLMFAAMFALFATVLWWEIGALADSHPSRSVFDLGFSLFTLAWITGWSVGTIFLGIIVLLLLFHGESARLAGGRLIFVPRLGPLKFVAEFDLARMRNLRAETIGGDADKLRVRFNYGEGERTLGDTMSRTAADHMIATIKQAAPATVTQAPLATEAAAAPAAAVTTAPSIPSAPQPLRLNSPSALLLIVVNCLPLVGVFSGQISLGQVMVLFWSESLIIGFFTVVKMFVVGKWAALAAAPFFAGHYGGFMAVHFMLIYGFFVSGPTPSAELPALEAITALYKPLWPLAAALFLSHAVSFALNFIGRREYQGETVSALMNAPYKRIMVLHLTLIFGGWITMLLGTPAPAVALLIGLKIVADLYAHTHEHRAAAATDQ